MALAVPNSDRASSSTRRRRSRPNGRPAGWENPAPRTKIRNGPITESRFQEYTTGRRRSVPVLDNPPPLPNGRRLFGEDLLQLLIHDFIHYAVESAAHIETGFWDWLAHGRT